MIRSRIGAGIAAGLGGGIVFGLMMQMMNAPTPQGGQMPMMAMVAKVVRSDSMAIGWLYHLFNSAIIGAAFGAVLGGSATTYGRGLAWGAAYGVFWWVLGSLILMPMLLGMAAFAPLQMAPMRSVALGSLVGHVMFGLILGGVFVKLRSEDAVMAGRARPA